MGKFESIPPSTKRAVEGGSGSSSVSSQAFLISSCIAWYIIDHIRFKKNRDRHRCSYKTCRLQCINICFFPEEITHFRKLDFVLCHQLRSDKSNITLKIGCTLRVVNT